MHSPSRSSVGRTFAISWDDWRGGNRRNPSRLYTATENDRGPADLLGRLPITDDERSRFLRRDSASTLVNVRLLAAAAFYFNAPGVEEFGGRPGSTPDRRLVEQVVGAAFQTFGDVDPHPPPFDKAAMLARGITQGHPFLDGNKRTGFLLSAYYLKILGIEPPSDYRVAEVVDLCVRVSTGKLRDIDLIAAEMSSQWEER